MALYAYDAAFSPSLVTCKARGAIAVTHYMVGSYAGTSPQPAAVRGAGMGVVLNWERATGALVGASRAQGRSIGLEAVSAVPDGCPRDGTVAIYFSVDLDVPAGRMSSCDQAFLGIGDALGRQFRPAMYGEGGLIDHLVAAGILHGKHWLSMSEGFGGFNAASPNVCLVQMHDAAGNWIGTDIPNTDRNTITDPYALGAWWPAGSPYTRRGDPPVTPAEIQAVATAVWARTFTHLGDDGKPDTNPHPASDWLMGSKPIQDAIAAIPPPPSVGAIVGAVIKSLPPAVSLTPGQVAAVAAAIAAKVPAGSTAYEGTVHLTPKT